MGKTSAKKTTKERDDLEVLKKELLNAISHMVRTPLSIVKEGLSLVLDEIPGRLNPKQRKIISMTKTNIDRLTQSIEEILKTSWDNTINPARLLRSGRIKQTYSKVSNKAKDRS